MRKKEYIYSEKSYIRFLGKPSSMCLLGREVWMPIGLLAARKTSHLFFPDITYSEEEV